MLAFSEMHATFVVGEVRSEFLKWALLSTVPFNMFFGIKSPTSVCSFLLFQYLLKYYAELMEQMRLNLTQNKALVKKSQIFNLAFKIDPEDKFLNKGIQIVFREYSINP